MPGLRGQKTSGVLGLKTCGLEFYHVLGLGAFGALDHLKLHFLVFGQGPETFADDGAVMHEHIRSVGPGDEAEALGVIKPLDFASFLHEQPPAIIIPLKKQAAEQSGKKKIGEDL
jgi:hypothetical protein